MKNFAEVGLIKTSKRKRHDFIGKDVEIFSDRGEIMTMITEKEDIKKRWEDNAALTIECSNFRV